MCIRDRHRQQVSAVRAVRPESTRRSMNRSLKAAITAALAIASLAFVAPVANASPAPATTEVQAVAPTLQSMPNSGALRVVKDVSQLPVGGVSYVVGSGSIVTVAPQSTSVDASPLFSVGVGWG